jgi:hypothetical protein
MSSGKSGAARVWILTLGYAAGIAGAVQAQDKATVERDRAGFAAWLQSSPVSPWRAVVVRQIGSGLTLGPEAADIPLQGVPMSRLAERDGRVLLRSPGGELGVSRGRLQTVEGWRLMVSGPAGRAALTVYAASVPAGKKLSHYPYTRDFAMVVALEPPSAPRTQRLLAADGVEVDASDAGTVQVRLGRTTTKLQVMRLPGATEDESELEIYFRDGTSGKTTYPSGRFVSLLPRPDGRYLLDFNRARNPFCAYNTVYPCPAPWRGNSLAGEVRAGERYAGGGLEVKLP